MMLQWVVEVAAVVAVIVVEIVVIVVDIAAVADNSNRVGAIVLYIVEDPVVDSIGIGVLVGVPVAVGSIDIGLVDIAKHKAKHKVEHMVDIVDKRAEVQVAEDKWYRVGGVVQDRQDKVDRLDTEDKEGKEHMVWVKAEAMAFYISGVDTILDESVMAQNYSYHNILHSILAYIYHY